MSHNCTFVVTLLLRFLHTTGYDASIAVNAPHTTDALTRSERCRRSSSSSSKGAFSTPRSLSLSYTLLPNYVFCLFSPFLLTLRLRMVTKIWKCISVNEYIVHPIWNSMRNGEWAHSAFYAFYVLLLICQMDLKAAAGGPGGLKRRDKTSTSTTTGSSFSSSSVS